MSHLSAVFACAVIASCLAWGTGCASVHGPDIAAAHNPMLVSGQPPEAVWETMVDVLHEYHFEIARENRLDGVIETVPRTGSGVCEPWHHDSVTLGDRLESSLQPIRRRVLVSLRPSGSGTLVSIQVVKEIEDPLVVTGAQPVGSAVFQESDPLDRSLDVVLGPAPPANWIPKGRDVALEQSIASRLTGRLSR